VTTRFASVVAAACTCIAIASAGEIHRWKDADGRIHYGDKPPSNVAAKPVAVPRGGGQSTAAAASPVVRVEESVIRHYDITGSTIQDLNAATRRLGPVSEATGMRVWGQCTWRITWDYTRGGSEGKCALEKLSLVLNTTIDMPRWTNRDAAPENVRASWDRFIVALRAHEDGHKDNGVRAANDLAKRLRALPPHKACADLDQAIGELGKRIMAEYRLLDQAYDRSTSHGVTQGAELK
jgi:predicted secreted Zn-dependent protease